MNQSARFLWYHDHAVGITRLNAYAGIASGLAAPRQLRSGPDRTRACPTSSRRAGNELPIIIQDKIFVGPDIRA